MEDFLLPCLNKEIFGIDCYGCGGQRALLLLLEGKFEAAYHMFPAIYTLLPLLFLVLFNIFIKFKYAYTLKIGLILLNATIIFISYIFKMYDLFNSI
ncbi:DUF2752 domain-containing protein [Gillisia sp. M10.2A]|uniref:DUF2752 domain-containing protein n=1 Tax=Gillisia lutea TaxID=2909668 RepID=A0ABS9EIY6_9FLAO|nr:DUF2752 domain-containing protein [Gillisia lutea]MCF4102791.1 DUF2752 domain-containing protein [Gillisia lutea]